MTKFKVCAKIHLFIIISSLIIAIGMAVGTICHFCAGGFFNYGGEFSSYKSVTVSYYFSEYKELSDVKPVCEEALKGFDAYEVSYYTEGSIGGEIVYKYPKNTDSAKLQEAVKELNAKLDKNGSGLNIASMHEGEARVGGYKAIAFAAIAVSAAAVFQFIYFVLRYKLRAAFSALLASVHNLGVYVALAAITRIPLGTEAIAIGVAVVLITMIFTCVYFDRTRKNFANEKYAKTDRLEVVDMSACEVRMTETISLGALAVTAVIFGVFAAIAQLWAGALAPFALAVFGLIACFYGLVFFTPAVHGAIDGVCEKVKIAAKNRSKTVKKKTEKSEKTADSAKDLA